MGVSADRDGPRTGVGGGKGLAASQSGLAAVFATVRGLLIPPSSPPRTTPSSAPCAYRGTYFSRPFGSRGPRLAPQCLPHSLLHVLVGFTPGCPLQRLLQSTGPRPSCPGGESGDGHVSVPDDRTPQPGLDQRPAPPREAPEVLQD